MVVQVLWPGATTEEMQDQVVDKIERKSADHIVHLRPQMATLPQNR
jgi:multidrug efflux pump subunit AcrB